MRTHAKGRVRTRAPHIIMMVMMRRQAYNTVYGARCVFDCICCALVQCGGGFRKQKVQ